jgi:hypothetical protein
MRLHPSIDVVAALDLPFVDVRRIPELLQLGGQPERPVAIALGIADEDVRHVPCLGPLRLIFKIAARA